MYSRYGNLPTVSHALVKLGKFVGMNADVRDHELPMGYGSMAYNIDFSKGRLDTGMGLKILHAPYMTSQPEPEVIFGQAGDEDNFDILASWFLYTSVEGDGTDRSCIVYYTSTGDMYYSFLHSGLSAVKLNIHLDDIPLVVQYRLNGEDVLLICSDGVMYTWSPNKVTKFDNVPSITSLCIHNERLFVTVKEDPNTVWYSDDLDPTNWQVSSTEAGFITMPSTMGRINRVMSFNNYVYVFRDYGISRIYASGGEENFYTQELFHSDSLINANTACICGDDMYLMVANRLYSYNGASYLHIDCGLESLLPMFQASATACFNDGKYYLATCMDFGDGKIIGDERQVFFPKKNNVLLAVDIRTKQVDIMRGKFIQNLMSLEHYNANKLVVIAKYNGHYRLMELTRDGEDSGEGLPKYFRTGLICPGHYGMEKVLYEIRLITKYDVTITVTCDKDVYTYNVKAGDLIQSVRVNQKFQSLRLEFSTNGPMSVEPFGLHYGEL